MAARDSRQRRYVLRRAEGILRQEGRCPCGGDLLGAVQIDHDHNCCSAARADRACGKCDRGVLHAGCNAAIALAGHDPRRLRNLADYLEASRQ